MSNQMPILACQARDKHGKIACKKLRNQTDIVIPAVLYGEKKASESISLPHKEVHYLHNKKKFAGHLFQLKIGNKKQAALVKAIQRHHLNGKILHVDLQRIDKSHKITTTVPIMFLHADECPAVKQKGQITYTTTELSVTCLPSDLPEHIALDLTELDIDQIIHLSDLQIPEGVEPTEAISESHNPTLVTAHMPKIIEEPEETEEDETAETDDAEDAEDAEDGAESSDQQQSASEDEKQ
jgi:large subunit ribosomal protein L25